MKLVLHLSSHPTLGTLDATTRIPPTLGLNRLNEVSSVRGALAEQDISRPRSTAWDQSFAGRIRLHTYYRTDSYSRGGSSTSTFTLQADSGCFRTDVLSSGDAAESAPVGASNYGLFIELSKAYYAMLGPVVGIAFDEDHERDVLYWEDAVAGRLSKLYNLTLLSPRFAGQVDPVVVDGLEVHRAERLPDGGLLVSLVEDPLSDDPAVRIRAEVELGFHPDVDPGEFRWRVALFDQALREDPERLAQDAGLSPADIERGKATSKAAGLPEYSFLSLLRGPAVMRALAQSRRPGGRRS